MGMMFEDSLVGSSMGAWHGNGLFFASSPWLTSFVGGGVDLGNAIGWILECLNLRYKFNRGLDDSGGNEEFDRLECGKDNGLGLGHGGGEIGLIVSWIGIWVASDGGFS
jgi:hypothetical protein